MSKWEILVPEPADVVNLITNPSIEKGTTGWATNGTNTIAKSSVESLFGSYSLLSTWVDNTVLFRTTSLTLTAVQHYFSIWVKLDSSWDGGNISVAISGFTNAVTNLAGTSTSTIGEWVRLEISFTPDAGDLTGTITIQTDSAPSSSATGKSYGDAALLTLSSYLLRYFDGDSDGAYWTGARHASTSTLKANDRAGGRWRDLYDIYGFLIDYEDGSGMPPVRNVSVGRGVVDGQSFQRAIALPRVLRLRGSITGSDVADYHVQRRALLDLVKPQRTREQPFRLRYNAADVNKILQVRYDNGFQVRGPQVAAERIPLQLIAYDPFLKQEGEKSEAIGPTGQTVTVAVAKINGQWTNFGPPNAAGSYIDAADVLYENPSSIYYCGDFENFDNIAAADYIVHWNGSAWEAVGAPKGGSTTISGMEKMVLHPDGTLYVVGTFTTLADVTNADYIAYWDGSSWNALGTPASGATFGNIQSVAIHPITGDIYVSGSFTSLAGVTDADYIAYWDVSASAWKALATNEGMNAYVTDIAFDAQGNLYATGNFTMAGTTSANRIAMWDGSSWTAYGTGLNGAGVTLVVLPNGNVVVGGAFTTLDGVTVNRIAEFGPPFDSDDFYLNPLGSGLDSSCLELAYYDGLLYAGGSFSTAGGLDLAQAIATWNGSSWGQLDIDLPGTPQVGAIEVNSTGIYLGTNADGTAYYSSTTTVTNSGSERAYPVITVERSGGSDATLQSIINETTGKQLLFDLNLLDGEKYIIDLRPGRRRMFAQTSTSFSSEGGDRWRIQPQSDVAEFFLESGDNLINAYVSPAAASNVACFIRWQDTYWGVD